MLSYISVVIRRKKALMGSIIGLFQNLYVKDLIYWACEHVNLRMTYWGKYAVYYQRIFDI